MSVVSLYIRFYGFFLLNSVKRGCICDYGKTRIVTCEKCFFGLNEGISKNVCLVAQKHAAYGNFNGNCMVLLVKNYQKLLIHEDAGRI